MRGYKMRAAKLEAALRLVMDCAGDIQAATNADLEAALSCGDPYTEKQANAWLVARDALAQQVAVPIPESQIDALSDYYLLAGAHECVLGVVEFVRAIEAHHKIGEKP